MPTNVNDVIRKLNRTQRKKVEARAAQLIAEEMTLRELRHNRETESSGKKETPIARTTGVMS